MPSPPPLGPRTWLRYDLVRRAVDAVGPESILRRYAPDQLTDLIRGTGLEPVQVRRSSHRNNATHRHHAPPHGTAPGARTYDGAPRQ